MQFPVHTVESAPEAAVPTLKAVISRYGFMPNLAAVFASSPGALGGLLALTGAYDHPTMQLSALQRQVVLLATSAYNECDYCMAAHGMLAHHAGLPRDDVARLQLGHPLADPTLQALRRLTEQVLRRQGRVDSADLEAFEAAGFGAAAMLEVLMGVALKTLTNYANHIARPALNEAFEPFHPSTAATCLARAA